MHDFAYADIAFDGYRPPSILQVPGAADVAVELVSLSKSHNMAGWRLGFVAGNAAVVAGLLRLKSYLDYGVSKPIQLMALTALRECEECRRGVAEPTSDAGTLCDGLPPRLARRQAQGTMFVWAPIPHASARAARWPSPSTCSTSAMWPSRPGIGLVRAGGGLRALRPRAVTGYNQARAARHTARTEHGTLRR